MAKPRFKTAPQIFVGQNGQVPIPARTGLGRLGRLTQLNTTAGVLRERDYSDMLRDPTIRLAVDVVTAMMMKQPWTIEGENEDYCNFTWAQVEPIRKALIRSSFRGYLRRGWRVFESAFGLKEDDTLGLRQTVDGVKSLRPQVTDILVDIETGEIVGAENRASPFAPVFIDKDHIIFVNFDEEGFGDYGEELLRSAHHTWQKWNLCDAGAERYDDKVAGGFLHLKYPEGTTKYGIDGEETDNATIAADLIASVRASGFGATPVKIDENDGDPKLLDAWKLEHISAQGTLQPGFITRLKYLDALKLRVFGVPERSTTEGTFGTKAEAEAHADIAILVNTERHERIVECVNDYLVVPLNKSNWDEPGQCRLVLGTLAPHDRELFQTIFTSLMADPVLGDNVAQRVDLEMLLEKLDIPTITHTDYADNSPSP